MRVLYDYGNVNACLCTLSLLCTGTLCSLCSFFFFCFFITLSWIQQLLVSPHGSGCHRIRINTFIAAKHAFTNTKCVSRFSIFFRLFSSKEIVLRDKNKYLWKYRKWIEETQKISFVHFIWFIALLQTNAHIFHRLLSFLFFFFFYFSRLINVSRSKNG